MTLNLRKLNCNKKCKTGKMGNNRVEHTLNKVVFLDRDGTLNEEVSYLHKTEDMKLLLVCPRH